MLFALRTTLCACSFQLTGLLTIKTGCLCVQFSLAGKHLLPLSAAFLRRESSVLCSETLLQTRKP